MIRLNWEREMPKHHPTWWMAYSVPVNGSFYFPKFEKQINKRFKHVRIEPYPGSSYPDRISMTFKTEEDSNLFIMLHSAGEFDQ